MRAKRENPEFREILCFDEEIVFKVSKKFLKYLFYFKNDISLSERAHLRVVKAEAEIVLYKIQHIISILNRIEDKLL